MYVFLRPTRPPTVQTVSQDIFPVTTPATIEEEEEKEEEKRLTELLETLIAEEKKYVYRIHLMILFTS